MPSEGWRDFELGRPCALKAGFAFKLDNQGSSEGELPFIKVSDMNDSGNEIAIRRARNWISRELANQTRAKALPPGTTVFAKIGEALKQNRVRQIVVPTIVDNNMMGAVPDTDIVDPKFFYYLLSTFDFARTATGTALPYLTVYVLSRTRFLIPQLDQQRGIAAILSAYDDLIEANQRRIAILEEMARRLFEEWFVRFRYPGHEAEALVETSLGPAPAKWSVQTAASAMTYMGGGTPSKTQASFGMTGRSTGSLQPI